MSRVTIQQAYDLAVEHRLAGRLREAEEIYRQILAHQPEHAAATHDLGLIAHQGGQVDLAIELFRKSIALCPSAAGAYNNLGNALKDKGQIDEAIVVWRQAIALNPDLPEAHSNLGNALKEKGQLDDAIATYRSAIVLRPDLPQAHGNLGKALHEQGRLDEAIAACRQAIVLLPGSAEAHNDLGAALMDKGQLDEAIEAYRHALALKPDYAAAQSNLGLALKAQGRLDEAIAALLHATMLDPSSPEALGNLGTALYEQGRLEDAITAFRQAIEIKPNGAQLHRDLAILLLTTAHFAEGWDEFEWRLKDETRPVLRDFAPPQWNGEDLSEKRLLLHTEGGFGDAFHYIRYVAMLHGRAKKIILECQPNLTRLFNEFQGVEEIVARGQVLPDFDYHIPLPGLPRLFKTDLETIPNTVPYVKVPAECRSRWSGRFQKDGRLRVGLAWAGSPCPKPGDDYRTRGLDIFAPLAGTPNVSFFSLQKGPESSLPRPPGLELIDFTSELDDFADTAALIENLDLVISVDTSLAHLAGALAKPVWVLIPAFSDFRWLLDRTDSPWYPTMRLFRQKRHGDWNSVAAELAAALAERAGAGRIGSS